MQLEWLTLKELKQQLDAGHLSSAELIEFSLARITRLEPKLHAFVDIYEADARALARSADEARRARLPRSPLHGLPVVLKDLLDIKGRIGTLGSKRNIGRVATETAAAVERLLGAGMVPLGKVHMTEFAFGGWGTNQHMGTPHNPWDLQTHRVPGGSSSGTGVAVAAGYSPVGIGSDTGGSIRIPCAFNGLTGLKVSFGRISLHGAGLLSWTLDSIGPMARTVADCALLLDALIGPDARDPGTLSQPLEQFSADPRSIRGLKIALPDANQLPSFMHEGVRASWQAAAKVFEQLGAQVISTRLPDWFFDLAAQTGRIIACEAFSLHSAYVDDPSVPLDDAVRKRLQGARKLGPTEYAQELRTMAGRRQEFSRWLEPFDALLIPTTATPAIPIAQVDEDAGQPGYLTRPGNYLGLCALAQPAGLVDGLPSSIQIVGKSMAERTVLSIGQAFESATRFASLHPDFSRTHF